jgi:hypothetical protein
MIMRDAKWAILLALLVPLLKTQAMEPAELPTRQTLARSWISVTSSGDVSRLTLDESGVGLYAYDLRPGDVRVYDVVSVTIDEWTVSIEAIARQNSEKLTLRGTARPDSIWIEWSKMEQQRFQPEAEFDRSLHEIRKAMTESAGGSTR